MIFVILILSVVASAFLFILTQKRWQRNLSIVFAACFVLSIGLIVANFNQHFGMETAKRNQTVNLVSSLEDQNANAILYKPLGDGTEKVYLYETKDSEKPQSAGSDHVINHVDHNADQAQLNMEKTEWVYKNGFYRFLFGISGNEHEFIKQENEFHLPSDWQIVSTEQS